MLVPVVLAMLVSCKSDPRSAATVVNVGGTVSTVPAGWVAIEVDDERLRCANHANDEWQVAIEHGAVKLTESKQHEADTGPALPFTPKQQPATRGRRHVLAVADGFLVGFDAGEWGGGLYWFSTDGANTAKLADENVHGLVKVAPGLVASIEGLSHMGISEGSVRWIEHRGTWRGAGALTALDAGPSAFAATPDAIYVVTSKSLVRVGTKDRKASTIQAMRTARLYPDSMAFDPDGTLWIGMRQFVVRMTPAGKRFTQSWLVREACVRATAHDLTCVCAPGPNTSHHPH
jgi:hypothetical protein